MLWSFSQSGQVTCFPLGYNYLAKHSISAKCVGLHWSMTAYFFSCIYLLQKMHSSPLVSSSTCSLILFISVVWAFLLIALAYCFRPSLCFWCFNMRLPISNSFYLMALSLSSLNSFYANSRSVFLYISFSFNYTSSSSIRLFWSLAKLLLYP